MTVRIRAFGCTLVGKHVHSGEGDLGSNPTAPKFSPKVSAARWRRLRNGPSKAHHTRYITLLFDDTYSVMNFSKAMRMSYAGLKDALR